MSKILLWGYYGQQNFGDDLMIYNIIDYLKNDHDLEVLTKDKNTTKIPDNACVAFYETFQSNKFKNLRLFIRAFKKNEYLIWGGGTCFSDQDGVVSPLILILAKIMHLKIFFIGVGAGDINKISNKFKMKINSFLIDRIYIRDNKSYQRLSRYFSIKKIKRTEDLAYLSTFKFERVSQEESITISLRNLDNYIKLDSLNTLFTNILRFIDLIVDKYNYDYINILVLDNKIDFEINKKLYQALTKSTNKIKKCRFYNDKDFNKKIQIIQSTKFLICFRLHGIFVSELLGKKTLGIGYSPKIESFMNSIDSVGYLSIFDVINNPDLLLNKFQLILENNSKVDFTNKLSQAKDNFDFIINKSI